MGQPAHAVEYGQGRLAALRSAPTEPRADAPAEEAARPRAIAHDLRQHVATVRALVDAALAVPDLPDAARELIGGTLDEASLITDLCRQLSELDRASEPVALDEVVEDSVNRRRVGSSAAWRCQLVASPVVGDRTDLVRIVENLLDNAVKAAGPEGSISVTLRRSGRSAVLTVGNSYPGWPGGTDRGTGLGLAIVQSLVRTHGGTVSFETDPDTHWIRVVVSFPSADPSEHRRRHRARRRRQ